MAAVVVGLSTAAVLLAADWLGLLTVVALGALGGLYLMAGDRWVGEYAHDVRTVRAGAPVSGFVRTEVESDVGLQRPVGGPRGRSPNSRPGGPRPAPETGGLLG
jgi:hypothetical protein